MKNKEAIKQIDAQNSQNNRNLTQRTIPTPNRHHDEITMVTEQHQQVDMDRHFPCLHPLTSVFNIDLQLKTRRDVPNQKVIDKIMDQLNSKSMHFYNLLFTCDTLRKGQWKDTFFSGIIIYLEDNNLPTNLKH